MKPDHRDTLLLAFENETLTPPLAGERWLVLNGRVLPHNPFSKAELIMEQGFRPEYLAIEKSGVKVVPSLEEDQKFDHAVVFAGRVRAVNEANIARAWQMTAAGGRVIVCGEKTSGIASLRKWLGGLTTIVDSYSKYHAVVFWVIRNAESAIAAPPAGPAFSADAPDEGSVLLARFIDRRIKGKVADFGAGTGYLSARLLESSPQVEGIDLLEAEWSALEVARSALAGSAVPLNFLWVDVASELKKKPYEWIVMNPPFHHGLHGGRQADPQLGKRFIQQAGSTLVQGGRLLMVANRNLPYEDTLQNVFRRVEKLADENGFKVFEAVR